ncbi:DUF4190 domain-containing protein [Jidongwangia harbinensis]|uniref:DUF4190 domain-containing protein n=1 Tax=Jidongwangia harbinensis TaxID=2878561 RepID=UPI001CDA43C6|nr:DUF4190 domain-containing protein [Jidongwangia harbinensis]MCA2213793.1 DUF4190 domain-containing protein [Jidongwangia harbinensis]
MTYPPSGGTPDPYQPQQPYGQPHDPTSPYAQDPYAAPASGAPSSGQPYPPPYGQPSSGQPYYGQPEAGKSPYSGPPYTGQPQPPYGGVAPTNTMAILSLVFAFIFAPAAIFLGHIARKQIKASGEQGWGLTTAGLWLGYIFTGLSVAACVFYVVVIVIVSSNSGSTY